MSHPIIRCTIAPTDARDFMVRTIAALLRQGGPSYRPDIPSDCMYRGLQGRACAAGMWITDGDYAKNMEGKPVHRLLEQNLLSPRHALAQFREEATFAQQVHDAAVRACGKWRDALYDAGILVANRALPSPPGVARWLELFTEAEAFASSDQPL